MRPKGRAAPALRGGWHPLPTEPLRLWSRVGRLTVELGKAAGPYAATQFADLAQRAIAAELLAGLGVEGGLRLTDQPELASRARSLACISKISWGWRRGATTTARRCSSSLSHAAARTVPAPHRTHRAPRC